MILYHEHAGYDQLKVADWSFTKYEYQRYKKVQNPGKIKVFELPVLCPLDYSYLFYTAPIWDQVPVDRVTTKSNNSSFDDFDLSQFTKFTLKCARLQFEFFIPGFTLPSAPWTYFSKCEKLEIFFADVNEEDMIMNHNVLKLVEHPNLHVVLGCPIRVSDANPR